MANFWDKFKKSGDKLTDSALYNSYILNNENNALSLQESQRNRDFQTKERLQTQAYNSAEAQKNRDYQTEMSNTAHQREVADLQAAGLNPVLSAGGNGAAVGNGAQAQSSAQSGDVATISDAITSAVSNIFTNLKQAETNEKIAQMSASAQIQAAQIGAYASMYGSDKALEGVKYQTDNQGLKGINNAGFFKGVPSGLADTVDLLTKTTPDKLKKYDFIKKDDRSKFSFFMNERLSPFHKQQIRQIAKEKYNSPNPSGEVYYKAAYYYWKRRDKKQDRQGYY